MASSVASSSTSRFYSAVSRPGTIAGPNGPKVSSDRGGESSTTDDLDAIMARLDSGMRALESSISPSARRQSRPSRSRTNISPINATSPTSSASSSEEHHDPSDEAGNRSTSASTSPDVHTDKLSRNRHSHATMAADDGRGAIMQSDRRKGRDQQRRNLLRAASPTSTSVSKTSSTVPMVSLARAAAEWQPGQVPEPLHREDEVAGDRSARRGAVVPMRHDARRKLDLRERSGPSSRARQSAQLPTHSQYLPSRAYDPRGGWQASGRAPTSSPRPFEIRISRIPLGCSKDELYALMASHLHRSPFSTRDRKLNFWLHLHNPPPGIVGGWGQINDGTGILTMPNWQVANLFMNLHGNTNPRGSGVRPSYAEKALIFERGNRAPPAGLLEWLARVPYPEKGDTSIRVQNDRKAANLKVDHIDFGIFCKDGVFANEHFVKMSDASFSFDYKWKAFRIRQLLEAPAPGYSPTTKLIVIKSSSVRLVMMSTVDDWYYTTIVLKHAPAFEQLRAKAYGPIQAEASTAKRHPQNANGGQDGIAGVDAKEAQDDKAKNQESGESGNLKDLAGRARVSAYDAVHQKTTAFTSRVIRFAFETEDKRNDFEDLLATIGCPSARYVELQSEARHLYADSQRSGVMAWLKDVSSRSVAFQLARLYQNGLLTPPELLHLRPRVERLHSIKGSFVTADVLHQYVEEMARQEDRWLDRILKDVSPQKKLSQESDYLDVFDQLEAKGFHRVDWRENYNSNVMKCLHVILTPTTMILEGPYADQSNRPLRKYGHHDHFIRVAFMDEDRSKYTWGHDIDWTAFLEERVGSVLRNGIYLGGRQYEFLGYSMSSLRSRSTWFCTKFNWTDSAGKPHRVTADYIRNNLGDFERVKRQPARYGARLAQAFTATDPSITLLPDQIEAIADVERVYRGETVCFTDGVGKISLDLARKVWKQLNNGYEEDEAFPSAFQFRLGGFKGVLTIDSALEGEKICVRQSQQKFDAPDSLGLEIAYAFSRWIPKFLNRPLIKVLEDLEVPHKVFLDLLEEATIKAEELKHYVREARMQLTLHGLGDPFAVGALVDGVSHLLRSTKIAPFAEGGSISKFIADSLGFAEVHILRMLKLKARIPVADAHVGVAVADESGTLRAGEIYTLRHNPGEPARIVQGKVLLVRAPTIDTGDIQFATAVGVPPPGAERFAHLPNVVIFSTQGEQPLISSLARGDMDGDLVSVIYDTRLFPKRTEPAMIHQAKTPVLLNRDCNIGDVIDFALRFFRNDILGKISNRHLLIADQAPEGFVEGCGTRHPKCRKLAALHAVAVDAPKSGQSIDMSELPISLFPHEPDFMKHDSLLINDRAEQGQLVYQSQKILGKLYRAIRLNPEEEDNQMLREYPSLETKYTPRNEDDRILIEVMHQLEARGIHCHGQVTEVSDREQAWYAMHTYAADLRHIAWSNTLNAGHALSEHELFIGTILHGTSATKVKQETIIRLNLQCRDLVEGVLHRLEGQDRDHPQIWANRVLASLRVAVSQGGHFGAQSFGAIALRSAIYLIGVLKAAGDAHAWHVNANAPFEPVNIESSA